MTERQGFSGAQGTVSRLCDVVTEADLTASEDAGGGWKGEFAPIWPLLLPTHDVDERVQREKYQTRHCCATADDNQYKS